MNYMYKLKKDKQISNELFKTILDEHANGKELKNVSKKEASDIITIMNAYTVEAVPF